MDSNSEEKLFIRSKIKNLTGLKFGKWIVLNEFKRENKKTFWKCKCDCGKEKFVYASSLVCGKSTSCGCVNSIRFIEKNVSHGLSKTRIYRIWKNMLTRCYNTNNHNYKHYGNRGVIICDEWKSDFIAFYNWSISHGYKNNLTIDRIDVNGNYEPNNCRWITMKKQENNRTNNHFITYNNKTQSLSQWAEELKISRSTLSSRIIRQKWSIEKALNIPIERYS